MTTAAPVVSVVLPVYNGARFLREAIDSVLNQTYRDFELVVVDDGSTDNSAEIASTFRDVRVMRRPHHNIPATRNAGLASAHGNLIAIIDSDDTWPANRLEVQVGCLDAHPEVDIAFGHFRVAIEPGAERPPWLPAKMLDRDLQGHPSTALVRRSVFERVGPFDESFAQGSDTDWILRVREANVPTMFVDDVVLHWRVHGENISYGLQGARLSLLRALHSSILRRRQTP